MADAKKWIDDLPPVTLPMTGNENVMVSQAGIAKRMKTEDFFAIFQGYVKIDGSTAFGGNQSMGSHNLKDLAAPLDDNDAVRLIDVNTFIGALNSLNTEAKNNVVSAINEVLATANSKVVTVNSQTDQVQLDLSLTGGILSITGGNTQINLDIRYLKNTDSVDWSKITGTPTTLGDYGIVDAVPKSDVGDSVASLVNGVLPTSQLPTLAITETYVVASEAAQLALTVEKGDICIRTDLHDTFINATGNNTSMSDWIEFETPASGQVQSVNGQQGIVVLGKGDVGLGNVDNTSDVNKPVSSATQTALNLKADKSNLAVVATSGSYNDLANTPLIPAAQVNTDWKATSGIQQILNRILLDNIFWLTAVPSTWQKNSIYFINPNTSPTTDIYIDDIKQLSITYLTKFSRLGVLRWTGGSGGYYYFDDWNVHDDVNDADVFIDDFESGNLNNWTINSGSPANSTDKAHSGIHSFKTSGGLTNVTKTNLSINTPCTITVWMYDDVTLTKQQVGALIDDGTNILCIGVDGLATTEQYYWIRTKDNDHIITSVPRSTGWHKIQIVFSMATGKKQMFATDSSANVFAASVGNMNLDDVLSNGNSSITGIIVPSVKAPIVTLSDNSLKSLKSLGTDGDGILIKAPPPAISKKTADYTITANDDIILGDTTAGAITFTLPNPGTGDMYFTVRNIGITAGNLLTIATSEAINVTGTTSITLDINKVTRLRYSGGIWYEV